MLDVTHKLATAETALAELAADPFLTTPQRKAVRGCISSLQGIAKMRLHALLRPVPRTAAVCAAPVIERQFLAAGDDSQGGGKDAA